MRKLAYLPFNVLLSCARGAVDKPTLSDVIGGQPSVDGQTGPTLIYAIPLELP